MSALQVQVCQHMVREVNTLTQKLVAASVAGEGDGLKADDAYTFELLSILQALGGSEAGVTFIAKRPQLLRDLISLLHFGTPRVQRVIVVLLKQLLSTVSLDVINAELPATGIDGVKDGLLPLLLLTVAKGLSVQLRTRGSGKTTMTLCMSSAVSLPEDHPSRSWLSGKLPVDSVQLVLKLIQSICTDGQLAEKWTAYFQVRVIWSLYCCRALPFPSPPCAWCLVSVHHQQIGAVFGATGGRKGHCLLPHCAGAAS